MWWSEIKTSERNEDDTFSYIGLGEALYGMCDMIISLIITVVVCVAVVFITSGVTAWHCGFTVIGVINGIICTFCGIFLGNGLVRYISDKFS